MARVLSILAVVVGMAFACGAITIYALESSGVAIVKTHAEDGSTRETHVWYAEPEGELWLEAGSPKNKWFEDLRRDPRLTLQTENGEQAYDATIIEDPAARARIRAELERKYGWRDGWIGLLVDHAQALVVKLEREAP